jgi:dihydroflavonol-4-reductase
MDYQSIQAGTQVLVTGATGFTGMHLVRKLLQQGARVRAIARPSPRVEELQRLGVEVVVGQVYEPAVIAQAVPSCAYIFHVAAAFREAKIQDQVYRWVHVDSTKLIAEAALQSSTFKRLVHVSTMGVHGHIENPPANEESAFAPGDAYQRTKLEAELWLRDFAAQKGLDYTIIRPTGIYGPGDRRLLKVFKMALWPVFPVLGNGKCLYHLTHVDDLTNCLILAALHPAAKSEAFLCGADQAIALTEIAEIVCRSLGKQLRVLRIPAAPFFILADCCEAICKPLGIEPPLYRRRVAFYTKDRSFDTSKLRTRLGFSNGYSNSSGISATAQWYRDNSWL